MVTYSFKFSQGHLWQEGSFLAFRVRRSFMVTWSFGSGGHSWSWSNYRSWGHSGCDFGSSRVKESFRVKWSFRVKRYFRVKRSFRVTRFFRATLGLSWVLRYSGSRDNSWPWGYLWYRSISQDHSWPGDHYHAVGSPFRVNGSLTVALNVMYSWSQNIFVEMRLNLTNTGSEKPHPVLKRNVLYIT